MSGSRRLSGVNSWRGLLSKLALVLLIELVYAVLTRVYFAAYFSGIELELCITAARIITLPVYWWLFRPLILSRNLRSDTVWMPSFHFAVAIMLLVPLLFGNDARPGFATHAVFALTSLVVGLREEMVYRAIVQNLLEERLGALGSILLASIAFAFYHYGYGDIPFTRQRFFELFLFGCIYGLIYRTTGSLLLVVLLHSLMDAIWAFSPILAWPLPRGGELWVDGLILGILLIWARLYRRGDAKTG